MKINPYRLICHHKIKNHPFNKLYPAAMLAYPKDFYIKVVSKEMIYIITITYGLSKSNWNFLTLFIPCLNMGSFFEDMCILRLQNAHIQ